MRQALLTLSLIFGLSVPCLAVEVVSIAGPVSVKLTSNTVSISDGLWTPYSPNIAYMLGKVGIGTSAPGKTLDILGTFNLSSGTNSFEIGTNDAFGRPQIWNKGTNAVLRLGQSTADGDVSDVDGKGLLIYGHTRNSYAYIKNDQLSLFDELAGTPYALFNSTESYFIGRAGLTGSLFSVSTGTTKLFNVLGTSVALKVPLVFPDGSIQRTAVTGVLITSCAVFFNGSNRYTGSSLFSGTDNFSVGDFSMNDNPSGSYNLALGFATMQHLGSGVANIGLGLFALRNVAAGGGNIGMGQGAGASITDANYTFTAINSNMANFTGSGGGDSGNYNIGIGYQGLYNMSTGDDNIAIGFRSGFGSGATQSGMTGNVLVGRETGFSLATNSKRNVMLGYQAGYNETGSDKLYVSSGPSTTPLIKGDFAAQTLNINGLLTISSATTSVSIVGSTATGSGSLLLGSNSPCGTLTGPATWIALKISNDGNTYYIPACK